MGTSKGNGGACPHCGMFHTTTCPRIAAIEYHPDGTVKRVEFGVAAPAFPAISATVWRQDVGTGQEYRPYRPQTMGGGIVQQAGDPVADPGRVFIGGHWSPT